MLQRVTKRPILKVMQTAIFLRWGMSRDRRRGMGRAMVTTSKKMFMPAVEKTKAFRLIHLPLGGGSV